MMYRNSEGYPDPTMEAVLRSLGEQKAAERREYRRRKSLVAMRPKVYIVSPFAGDVQQNIKKARRYCRFAAFKKYIPIASHLIYPQFLNDNDYRERELGLMFGLALMRSCQEVWVFGSERSNGMIKEIEEANWLKKTVRYFTEDMEELNEITR